MNTKADYKKKWKSLNKEREKENNKRWYEENKDSIKVRKEKYHTDNAIELRLKSSKWRKTNRSRINKLIKEDPVKRIGMNIRSKISKIIKGRIKQSNTIDLISCSMSELKTHLESKFQPGMTWDNYGVKGWHIDHIRPLSSFNLIDNDELKLAWHYSNLQPLWATDNLKKGSKYEY